MPLSGVFGPELFNATNQYLQVHINGERLSPRQPIGSVPYAFQSTNATTLYTRVLGCRQLPNACERRRTALPRLPAFARQGGAPT